MFDWMTRLDRIFFRLTSLIEATPEDHATDCAIDYLIARGMGLVAAGYATEHGRVTVMREGDTLVFIDLSVSVAGEHPTANLMRTSGEEVRANRRASAWIREQMTEAQQYADLRTDRVAVVVNSDGRPWRLEHKPGH